MEDRKKRGFWFIYENCFNEALKYSTRKDFQKNGRGAYAASIKKGWLEAICSHMTPMGNSFIIYGYAIEFNDIKKVYVGITCDINRRKWQHTSVSNGNNKSSNPFVKKLIEDGYRYKWVTSDDISNRVAAKKFEDGIIQKYKSDGWDILNIKTAGALGSCRKYWTKSRLVKEALKYKTKKEFYSTNPSAYGAAQRMGILELISKHLTTNKKIKDYWNNKDICIKAATSCQKQSEFRKKFKSAYKVSKLNGWLGVDIVFSKERLTLKGEKIKKMFYWTKENCQLEAIKYADRTSFQKKSKAAYATARKKKWLNEICSHMEIKRMPAGYWTLDKCIAEGLKYETRGEFSIKSPSAYNNCKKNGWRGVVCAHMKNAWELKRDAA